MKVRFSIDVTYPRWPENYLYIFLIANGVDGPLRD